MSRPRGAVLVVDDEEIVGNAIRRALTRDHDVSLTTSAEEALDLIESGAQFDIILCDLMMPHMTGMDLHAELKRRFPAVARRMVFLTGGAFTAGAREFLERVENQWIEKPFDVVALRAMVEASLK
jgi:CheY-like chemotaxis protein